MTEFEFNKSYDLHLDEQQEHLLAACGHPLFLNGKTGSGKTFLFLCRIAYLIKRGIAQPDTMLNIVFDKAMAAHLMKCYKDRFAAEDLPVITDLYAYAYGIIRHDREIRKKPLQKAYRDMTKGILRIAKEAFGIVLSRSQSRKLGVMLSQCRNSSLTKDEMTGMLLDEHPEVNLWEFHEEYTKFKTKKGIYDDDDVVYEAIQILKANPDRLAELQQHCRFVMVDDAQNAGYLAHELIQLVSSATQDIMLFADTDMSSTASHSPQVMQLFTQAYPNGEVFTRNEQYRSNATIVNAANRFFYADKDGMRALRNDTCELKLKGFRDLSKLYDYAMKKALEHELDIAFLYHDFAMAVPLIELCKEQGVSFRLQGNMKQFLQERFVLDMWNFIELLVDPRDMRAFYEIYEALGLDISKRVLLEISERLQRDESVDVYQALMESSYKQTGKKKLASMMESIRIAQQQTTLNMVFFIKEKLGYDAYLKEAGIAIDQSTILAFEMLAQRYEDPDEFLYKLASLKELETNEDASITISSIAGARGYEYHHVCLLDCIRHIFPNSEENEEERQLFFIGMTRAKQELEFLSAKRCIQQRLEISPFLYELHAILKETSESTKEVPTTAVKKLRPADLKRGVKLRHTQLGIGTIIGIGDGMMKVRFQEETKQMNIRLCIANQLIELC